MSLTRAELAAIALAVAEEAGALVFTGYRTRPSADHKGQHDLVTAFDRASEALLVARLGSLTPGVPIVAEEAFSADRDRPGRPGLIWYVDPLDGTTNFVHGHPFWCVSVGLMCDDRPILGAVVAPALGLRWSGWVAAPSSDGGAALGGAVRNGQACGVSATPALAQSLVATGFPAKRDHAPENNFASFTAVKRAARGVRRCGSAAIDLCMVADGTYDGYWERRLGAWDVVGGSAIALAAGATITALGGGTPDFHRGHLVVSNGLIHDALIAAVNTEMNTEVNTAASMAVNSAINTAVNSAVFTAMNTDESEEVD